MTAAATFTTSRVDVWDLEPGDVYVWGTERETREVLGILQRGPSNSALLEVRKPSGDVVQTTLCGRVPVVDRVDLRAQLGAGADYVRGSEQLAARI